METAARPETRREYTLAEYREYCARCLSAKTQVERKYKQLAKRDRKTGEKETLKEFIWRCRLAGAILPRRCPRCLRLYDSWLGFREDKFYRAGGVRQCCRTCKYLRQSDWDGDERAGALEREWAFKRMCELMRTGVSKEVAYKHAFDQQVWHYADGYPRHVGEERGEYPGIPICELDVIDFDDYFGGLAWKGATSQRDGRIGRLLQEEWARITDPGQHANRIRFSPNAPVVRGETEDVEHPELGFPEEQHRIRSANEGEIDLTIVLTPEGLIKDTNRACVSMLGYGRKEITGQNWLHLVHPEDAEMAGCFLAECGEEGAYSEERSIRLAHAKETWRELRGIAHNLLSHPKVGGIVLCFWNEDDCEQGAMGTGDSGPGHLDECFPTRALPEPPPEMINYQSAGKGGAARSQVSISQRRFIENFLWEFGCNLGVHRITGKPFTIWEVARNGKNPEESDEERMARLADDLAEGMLEDMGLPPSPRPGDRVNLGEEFDDRFRDM